MIYRVFEDRYADSVMIGEFGSLLLAKVFLTTLVEYGENVPTPIFYDSYRQDWSLNKAPEYYMTEVQIAGVYYKIYLIEDSQCLECGQD